MTFKIGIDGTPLLGNRSGVGNYTARLLSALVAARPEWEYLLYSNRPLGNLEAELARVQQVRGQLPMRRWMWMQTVLPMLVARTRPDLCHFTNALAPVMQPTPFVLTIHDASLFLFSNYHPRARLMTIRAILPVIARQAAAVITVSEHARLDLMRVLGLPAGKVHVVQEAAPSSFRPVTDGARLAGLRQKYGLPESFILYVGTLEPRKNLGRLVRALKRVREEGLPHHLVMVGEVGWMMEGFAREIEELGLQDVVHLTGFVPTEDLPGLFSLATLFAFPSLYEGFGLPPLEAMACGAPVLSSNNSSLAEVCGDAAYLIEPQDEDALVEGLRRLLRDPELRAELSRRGLERARSFSWERAAEETAAIYSQVLGRPSGQRRAALEPVKSTTNC
jgi:glycosyltransferase involved in cell wall biosynthesis